jgi:hypothetical protein
MIEKIKNNKAALLTWVTMFSRAFVLLFITPEVISSYDPKSSNQWLLILSIYQFFMLFDSGFTPALTRLFSYSSIKKNVEFTAVELNWASSFFYILLPIIGCGVVSFIFTGKIELELSVLLFIFFSINIFNGKYIALLEGLGGMFKSRGIQLVQALLQTILLLFAVRLKLDMDTVITLYFLPVILSLCLYHFLSRSLIVRSARPQHKKPARLVLKKILSDSLKGAISVFSTIGAMQLLVIYIAGSSSVEDGNATLYIFMLVRQLAGFAQVPFYIRLPEMARLYATGGMNMEVFNIAKKSWLISISFLLIVSALLFIVAGYEMKFLKLSYLSENFILYFSLVICFSFERTFAMTQQFFAMRGVIVWHFTGPIFLLLIFSSFNVLKYSNIEEFSLPLAIGISSITALFFSNFIYRRVRVRQ